MSQSYNFFEVLPLIDEISSHSSDLAIDRSSRIPKKSILENEINPVTKTKGLQEKKMALSFIHVTFTLICISICFQANWTQSQ